MTCRNTFTQAETKRWAQLKAGALPPPTLDPNEKLDDLMQEGYTLIYDRKQLATGSDRWLAAWELVKQLATPAMRTVSAFDRAYPFSQFVSNWASDMEMELGNAGIDDARYHEHRLRFAREYLAQFPDDDDRRYLNMRRAEGEALWHLGRQAEAEAVYQALVKKLPDDAWAYIGWADNYSMWRDSTKDYPAAERILRQALERPTLEDRQDVLERLIDLYEAWEQPDKQAPLLAELAKLKPREIWSHAARAKLTSLPELNIPPTPQVQKPKRNGPCWCGSGKKYKHCHIKSDRSG